MTTFNCFLLSALVALVASECPEIYPRDAWEAARSRDLPVLPIRPATYLIVHATGTEYCVSRTACAQNLRNIQNFQMTANGWRDISYHFMMAAEYRVYTGRGWGRLGENVGRFTNQAINVGFIGRYQGANRPTANATNVLNDLIDCGIAENALSRNVRVVAQCQVTPIVSCDDSGIFDWISEHPRFESNPIPV